ncbi:MAG: hypothetical protein NZZ41_04900 [Candidatus Dojkabacteria bacterium]|nr:hypothetical protein [Candidatus Dojkabacteria bacterium]
MNIYPFKIKEVINKNKNPIHIIFPKEFFKEVENKYSEHFSSEECLASYYVAGFIGSKNLNINPVTIYLKNVDVYTVEPYVVLDSRWYFFKYKHIADSDNPDNLPPNCFLKETKTNTVKKEYYIVWRKLTSDETVFIRHSIREDKQDQKNFWNGKKWLTDEEVHFSKTDEGIINIDNYNSDSIYLKTKHYIDIIRNSTYADSLSLLYKKYSDNCLRRTTFLFKRIRGSYCVDVAENLNRNIKIGLSTKETCNGGCVPCWELIARDVKETYNLIKQEKSFKKFREYINNKVSNPTENLTWIDLFNYNVANSFGYNSFSSNFLLGIDISIKQVTIEFDDFALRQNKFFGFNPFTGNREHHGIPIKQNFKKYSYYSIASLIHPKINYEGSQIDVFKTLTTEDITDNKIKDGKERVVVPPGVIFRTFKAIPGIIDLNELDTLFTRPDEFHFAVDNYGNILGYKNLPYPGLLEIDYPLEPNEIKNPEKTDKNYKKLIEKAWKSLLDSNPGSSQPLLFDQNKINQIYQIKLNNKYYLLSKLINVFPQNDYRYTNIQKIDDTVQTSSHSPLSNFNIQKNLNCARVFYGNEIIYGNKIFILGGINFSFDRLGDSSIDKKYLNSIEVLDMENPNENTWVLMANMNERRCLHSSHIIFIPSYNNHFILVAGGYNDEKGSLNSCEIYNISENVWTMSLSPMKRKRTNFKLINHPTESLKILAIGGYEEITTKCGSKIKKYHKEIEVYDIMNDKWEILKNFELSYPREDFAVVRIPFSNKILVYGGYNDQQTINQAELFDFSSNTKKSIFQKSSRRFFSYSFLNNKYYFSGGLNESGPLNSVEYFDELSENFYEIAPMNKKRYAHSMTNIENTFSFIPFSYSQTLIAVGGIDEQNNELDTVEVYNPNNNVWEILNKKLNNTQSFCSAVSIKNNLGNFLVVFGGINESTFYQYRYGLYGIHTYVNIHHCPIWVEKDIFHSYLFNEDPIFYAGYKEENCPEKIPTNIYSKPPLPPEIEGIEIEENKPVEDDKILNTSNPVHGVVDIKTHGKYNFIVPNGVTKIKVYLWGAGGGGGGYAQLEIKEDDRKSYIIKAAGGGGGGGGHVVFYYDVTSGLTIPYTIGKGGKTGCSVVVEGIKNKETNEYKWYNLGNEINEYTTISLSAQSGENGGTSIFGSHSINSNALVVVFGGQGGLGGTCLRLERNAVGGNGGIGSPGGIVNTSFISKYSIYTGFDGEKGDGISMGPLGPSSAGGVYNLTNKSKGGKPKVQGAGVGGDGQYALPDMYPVLNGEDGRIRIVW